MANRKTTFLLRRSNIQDKIPDLTGLTIGELALNTADAKLYTIYTSGTTGATEVREIGWNRLSIISGGTVSGDTIFISGVTGNSFNISSIPVNNNTNTQILTRNTLTGEIEYRDVSSISAGGSSSGSCNVDTTTTIGLEYKKITTISGFTNGTYIVKSYITTYSGDTNYGFWERTVGVITTTGGTPTITQTTEDFDNYVSGFVPSQVVYSSSTGNTLDVYISGITGGDYSWTSYYEIKGLDCFGGGGSSLFTGNTSADCINDIFVKNLHSCSPLNINPNDEGNVYFGSTSGITIDVSNKTLNVSGNISGNTFYGSGIGLTNIPFSSVTDLQSKLNEKFDKTGGTVTGNVTVNGNVTILGTATTINTETLSVKDNIITLNSNYSAGTPFIGSSGIEVLRGSATTAVLLWDESNSYWVGGLSGTTKRILFSGDVTDVYITGGTYSASSSTIIFTNNTGGTFNVTGITATGGGTFTGGTVSGATNFTNGLTANTFSSSTISVPISNTQIIYSNSGVLTGSTAMTWSNSATTLTINGTLEATSKSFSIPHPTKEGKKLVYGSLEGPENGVYHRGKLYNEDTIILPEYWSKLVDKDTVTIHLTSIGKYQNLYVKEVLDDKVIIGIDSSIFSNKTINCYYVVYGERKDINKLEIER